MRLPFDVSRCRALKECDRKEACARWLENQRATDQGERIVISDFSGKPAPCDFFIDNDPKPCPECHVKGWHKLQCSLGRKG